LEKVYSHFVTKKQEAPDNLAKKILFILQRTMVVRFLGCLSL